MNNFQPGHFAPVQWQPTGGVTALLNIKEHTLDISVLLHDVTHTGTLGVRARIAGPLECAGTVNADLDLDAPPYLAPPLILPGLKGVAAFGFSLTRALQVPVIVEKLHFASSVEKEVQWSFDAKMNALAGLVVYPAL